MDDAVLSIDRIPAMDCRSFSKFLRLNKPRFDGLTQLVILMYNRLGFSFIPLIDKIGAKTLIKLSLLQKT
ncbi:MAG: hypothetical protein FVQ84_13130 [Planctomycetes bacterium]|nr:hypothetical protein [Planctomycetota bacterium]